MKRAKLKEDKWRPAILAERKRAEVHPALKKGLTFLEGEKETALILGDASLVQTRFLLDSGFSKVVDVDSSTTLMDNDIIETGDERVKRVLSTFDTYSPPVNTFDFIYGKSIAVNPKKTIEKVLVDLSRSLKPSGIFTATYALKGDSFRKNFYTEDELGRMYKKCEFKIIDVKATGPRPSKGLIHPGISNVITLFAKRV